MQASTRKHGFALERAVFLSVLHRLFVSGSDRAADRWREDYAIAGIDALDLHQLYRAMAWLGEELAAKDQDDIVAALARQLKRGDKALVGNAGYRRYLRTISDEHFAIDADKVEEEKRFDGIFVLRTNAELNPLEAMLCYKQLWTVEQPSERAGGPHRGARSCSPRSSPISIR